MEPSYCYIGIEIPCFYRFYSIFNFYLQKNITLAILINNTFKTVQQSAKDKEDICRRADARQRYLTQDFTLWWTGLFAVIYGIAIECQANKNILRCLRNSTMNNCFAIYQENYKLPSPDKKQFLNHCLSIPSMESENQIISWFESNKHSQSAVASQLYTE